MRVGQSAPLGFGRAVLGAHVLVVPFRCDGGFSAPWSFSVLSSCVQFSVISMVAFCSVLSPLFLTFDLVLLPLRSLSLFVMFVLVHVSICFVQGPTASYFVLSSRRCFFATSPLPCFTVLDIDPHSFILWFLSLFCLVPSGSSSQSGFLQVVVPPSA